MTIRIKIRKRLIILLLIVSVLLVPRLAQAQILSFGGGISRAASYNLETSGPREYPVFKMGGNEGRRLNGLASLQYRNLDLSFPEVFTRYKFKNNFFIQAGYYTTVNHELVYEGTTYSASGNLESASSSMSIGLDGVVPYLTLSYFLSEKTVVKPYALAGPSLKINSFSNTVLYPSINYERPALRQDLGDVKKSFIMMRVGLGVNYYDFNVELYYERSVGPLEESSDPYLMSYSVVRFGVYYTLFSFNMIKKKS